MSQLLSKEQRVFLINRFKFGLYNEIRCYEVTGTKFLWKTTSLYLPYQLRAGNCRIVVKPAKATLLLPGIPTSPTQPSGGFNFVYY